MSHVNSILSVLDTSQCKLFGMMSSHLKQFDWSQGVEKGMIIGELLA
jgi:hypothetical protein